MAGIDADADNDDFSFPTVNNIPNSSITSSIDSPLFWQLSVPSASTDGKHQDSAAPSTHPIEKNQNQLKRISCMDQEQPPWITSTTNKVEHHDKEEKMDLLWEDFNEELYPVRSTAPSDYNYDDVSGQMLKLGCVGLGAFNLSKSHTGTSTSTNANTSIAKPAGVLEIIKVLRRLFFLHNINSHHHSLDKPAKW